MNEKKFLKNIRIADLELFILASNLKNLGKAAKLSNLSQSAASIAVQRVESSFSIKLCNHQKRNFALTKIGEILLPKLEKWLNELKHIIKLENQFPIRFCTTHSIAQIIIPNILKIDNFEFEYLRPDQTYEKIINNTSDLGIVIDNFPLKKVETIEITKGKFQLYSKRKDVSIKKILISENQMEVLHLKQDWKDKYDSYLPIKSIIPSWSLIASICMSSDEVGFLPDFIAKKFNLYPISWNIGYYPYRLLAIYKNKNHFLKSRFIQIVNKLKKNLYII
jgi:hypothetical protein